MGSKQQSSVIKGARERLSLGQLAWLFSGAALPVSIVIFAVWSLAHVQIPQGSAIDGRLRPLDNPTTVDLPAPFSVSRISVHDGDSVEKGDVLFRLDTETGATLLNEMEKQAQGLRLLRSCLMSWPFDPFAKRRETDAPGSASSENDGILEPATQCDVRRASVAASLLHVSEIEENLRERLSLLDQKVHLLRRDAGRNGVGNAYQALSTALAHNLLKAELIDAQAALQTARISAKQDLLAEARKLGEQLDALRLAIAHIRRQMSDPLIRAPFSGVVRRVRIEPNEGGINSDIPAVEIQPDGSGYVVDVDIQKKLAKQIEPGRAARVLVHIAGRKTLELYAYAQSTAPTDHATNTGMTRARFLLDADSAAALVSGQSGLALHGRATSALVKLQLAPTPVQQRLKEAMTRAVSTQDAPWRASVSSGQQLIRNIIPLSGNAGITTDVQTPPSERLVAAPDKLELH